MRVKSPYAKYSQMKAASGYTGAEAAVQILQAAGIYDVEIREHEELLGDHYDPMHKRLVLSSQNYHGTSTAALGVAAHECGHAIQHHVAYSPLHGRMAAVGVTNLASQIVMWLPLIGIFTGFRSGYTGTLLMAIGWGIIMAFSLVTLPEGEGGKPVGVIHVSTIPFAEPAAAITAERLRKIARPCLEMGGLPARGGTCAGRLDNLDRPMLTFAPSDEGIAREAPTNGPRLSSCC